jgi:hypothetical protein
MAGKLKDIKALFNLRLLGGEVPVDDFMKFNKLRFDIIEKHPEHERYLKSKSSAIRMFVNMFLVMPYEVLELAIKSEKVGRNGKSDTE